MDEIEVFLSVAENSGFTAAATSLGLTVTAVSRRIKALERRLGVRLINRTTRRLHLTEAGEIYFRECRQIIDRLRETEARINQLTETLFGQLRITAPMTFGTRTLAPMVTRFADRHPELRIQLNLDDQIVDIVAEGFDLALRVGYPRDSSLIIRRLCRIERRICASPDYLARRGEPTSPDDLLHHSCLHYSNLSVRDEWTLRGPGEPRTIAVDGRLCSNNAEVLREAAECGLGIALLPGFAVDDAIAAGTLRAIMTAYVPEPFHLYALYPSREYVPAKIRGFLDFLAAELGQQDGGPWRERSGRPQDREPGAGTLASADSPDGRYGATN